MQKIKKIFILLFVAIFVIVFTSDRVCFVSAQDMTTDYWTPIVASLPSAFMGVINLALVSRLASNSNRGGGNGLMPRFLSGPGGGKQKKMIFLGKHNIQVSNSHTDSGGGENGGFDEEEEGCCDEEDEYEDEFDEEEEEEEEEFEEEDEEGKDKDKNKGKNKSKVKKNKYKKDEKEEDENYNPNYKNYNEQENGELLLNYDKFGGKPYGVTGLEGMDELDYNTITLKNAISAQYPNIDPGQMYYPQSEESMNKGFHSEPTAEPEAKMIVGIPKQLPLKETTLLPIFKKSPDQVSISHEYQEHPVVSNWNLPILDPDQLTNERPAPTPHSYSEPYDENPSDNYQQTNVETNGEQQYTYDNMDDNQYQNGDNFNREKDFQSSGDLRRKRSSDVDNSSSNRAGNVPPLRMNKTSTPTLDSLEKISPDVIRLLLSAVKNKAQNERNEKKSHTKKSRKSHKRSHKKKSHSSESEVQSKSSSDRVSTKLSVKESEQPVKYLPLNQYKNILNYPADRKQDSAGKKKKRRKKKKHNNDSEEDDEEEEEEGGDNEDVDEEQEEEIEEEGCCEGSELDDIPDEGSTTVQIIEKPDEKFNWKSSWMSRMFSFRSSGGRRRRLFNRGNSFR